MVWILKDLTAEVTLSVSSECSSKGVYKEVPQMGCKLVGQCGRANHHLINTPTLLSHPSALLYPHLGIKDIHCSQT